MSVSAVRDWITSRLTGRSVPIVLQGNRPVAGPERQNMEQNQESHELKALQHIEAKLDEVNKNLMLLETAIMDQTEVLKEILAKLNTPAVGAPVKLVITAGTPL